ncbi:helix-turn-helix transcriptional regulator [Vibrio comitans]
MSKINRALEYINKHYLSHITADEVANHCGCSVFYLPKLFRNHMDMSYQDYLTFKRIEHAKTLLIRPGFCKIAAVAYESGFVDDTYFCRIFKKKTNLTPTQYRRQYLEIQKREQEVYSGRDKSVLQSFLLEEV